MIKFFEWLWFRCIKNWWSKLRWYKYCKASSEPVPKVNNDSDIKDNLRWIYSSFNWQMDGIKDAFDTYYPPQHAFNLAYEANIDNVTWDGDCDDYHGAIYHLLHENGYDVALITLATIPITKSHTMTAIRFTEEDGTVSYKVVNYTHIIGPYKSLQEFVDNYGTPVRYWCLQKYNYDKGTYYNIDINEF